MEPLPLDNEAREAMRVARDHARAEGSGRAGREHILLALLEAPGAGRLFEAFRAPAPMIQQVLPHLGQGFRPGVQDDGAEESVVARAASEARRLGHPTIGSEHLVLALLAPTETPVGGLLATIGLSRDAAREAVRFLHGQVPDWEPPDAWVRDQQGSSYVVGSFDLVEEPEGEQLSEDELAYWTAMAQLEADGPGLLHRVVGIGATADVDGIAVELIALEVRTAVATLIWRFRSPGPTQPGRPRLRITDDVGTVYGVLDGSWSGDRHMMSGEMYLQPPPPDHARILSVEVLDFLADEPFRHPRMPRMPAESSIGPWRFEVPLGDPP